MPAAGTIPIRTLVTRSPNRSSAARAAVVFHAGGSIERKASDGMLRFCCGADVVGSRSTDTRRSHVYASSHPGRRVLADWPRRAGRGPGEHGGGWAGWQR
ncbi:hypothetical protein GCM10011608_01630 [Micromonospora sonchi]|uniref:Uncharacterized protein n=1 Tax=Micromonospora sonchi TaxID=1763543 RepID=A0A917TEP5_9ACTN|nr:hypothetical protein GCM10011608_01630 [Micromonospora sonchi]